MFAVVECLIVGVYMDTKLKFLMTYAFVSSLALLLLACKKADVEVDQCAQESVCVTANQYESYLLLGISNMSREPITLPALHGIGKPSSPAMFTLDLGELEAEGRIGRGSGSIGIAQEWSEIVLYPNESITYALRWQEVERLFSIGSGCSKVTLGFKINEWAKSKGYYTGKIQPSIQEICVPRNSLPSNGTM
jgi:hypothetical protein